MSTNTADLTNYHPKTPLRRIEDYADILHAKRPLAKNPISVTNRAAQFSPYAALVGHKDIIQADETLANKMIDLNQDITIELEADDMENYNEPC